MKVKVVAYDPYWQVEFENEKVKIKELLNGELVYIEHIGSTSIPNLSAKPVIDILVSVKFIDKIDELNDKFIELGYRVKGEFGIPGRRFFSKDDIRGDRSHQIHIFQDGNSELQRHINFREFMINHPEDANEYAQLKINLAKQFPQDVNSYNEGKAIFIRSIDIKAKRSLNSEY